MIEAVRLSGWDLPPQILSRLGRKAGRQRAMAADGHLLLILHDLPTPGAADRTARLFHRPPEGPWKTTAGADGLPYLHKHVAAYADAVERLEDDVESAADADTLFRMLRQIAPLHRATRNLHGALQQAREATDDPEIITLRDAAGDAERSAELLHNDARLGLEYMIARQAELQTHAGRKVVEASHRLNLLAAAFIPLTAVGAALGMNVASGLEDVASPWIFWLVVAAAAGVGAVLYGEQTRAAGRDRSLTT